MLTGTIVRLPAMWRGHVPADGAREEIVATADAIADEAGDGLAAVEVGNRLRRGCADERCGETAARNQKRK
jgi:hypothetical protein